MGFVDNILQTESKSVVSSNGCNQSEEKTGGGMISIQNGNSSGGSRSNLPKRRRICAIRDFPSGCGRFASRIDDKPNEERQDVCVGKVGDSGEPKMSGDNVGIMQSLDNIVINGELDKHGIVVNGEEENRVQSNIEEVAVLFERMNGVESMNVEGLNDGRSVVGVEVEGVECKGLDGLKGLCEGDVMAPVGEMVVQRKYLQRKKVSAVRDFPPFCGRNALRPTKEQLDELGIEENPMEVTVKTDLQEMGDDFSGGDAIKGSLGRKSSCTSEDGIRVKYEGHTTKETGNKQEFVTFSLNKMKLAEEDVQERSIESSHKGTTNRCVWKSEMVPKLSNNLRGLEENLGKESVIYTGNSDSESKDSSYSADQMSKENFDGLKSASNRVVVVLGLLASKKFTCRQGKMGGTVERNGKQNDFSVKKKVVVNSNGSFMQKDSSATGNAYKDAHRMIALEMEDDCQQGAECDNFGLSIPPVPSGSGSKADCSATHVTRNKVRKTLRLYQVVFRNLLQEKEAMVKAGESGRRRIDLQAAKLLKEKGKYVNVGKQIIGSVPGVEVGDEFHYWVELNIIGLHRAIQAGIDYVKQGQNLIATSIVASGGYDDNTDNSDVLIYMGSGGNMMGGDKEPEDQKLERGNLALKNSIDERNPVRVIRGDIKVSDSVDARVRTYIYDGLYLVEKYWQDIGSHGKLVFKFKLVRIPGQPELAWKAVTKSKKFKVRDGLCLDDISQGKEKIPICAVNTIDDEKPPPFTYVTQVIYPKGLSLKPLVGCGCTNGCLESRTCSCIANNEGEIPYNHNGAIVKAKPLVYECGPACKCPPSCYNRVTQHGIRFQLEIFKTESRGWGVRSLNSISSGSFICEYAGGLLEEKEAEQRVGNDEYLFDIGNKYNDSSFWDELSTLIPGAQASSREVVEDGSFTIDAAHYGNVGRFINHSCSPNLYAQNVLYDHLDKRIPHIMLFAVENIPPLEELTYHYNYMIDQVRDSGGNIKKKSCYCGSSECTGRLY